MFVAPHITMILIDGFFRRGPKSTDTFFCPIFLLVHLGHDGVGATTGQ